METKRLYTEHLDTLRQTTVHALAIGNGECAPPGGWAGVVFHAGSEGSYHADDQHVPFKPVPHFARFAPVPGPDHLLVFRPDADLRLIRVVRQDFWVEAPREPDHPFREVLDTVEVATLDELKAALGDVTGLAYVGSSPSVAASLGIHPDAVEPRLLLSALDWERACKTPYEVACIRIAAEVGARGHKAVQAGVASGLSERELHFEYLRATGLLEHEVPYPNIIAWDERGAVLHYTSKRESPPDPGRTFLIDAGGVHLGYCSDITRTYVRGDVHPVFRQTLERMLVLQDTLVEAVQPGVGYVDLHERAFRGVCEILCELGILTVGVEEAFDKALAFPFFPHGLGHHLGLQVHDVGGKQVDPQGTIVPAPERFPWLRTTRPLEEGHVVTIEPGLYFIPLLLDPHRTGPLADAFAWSLIDELIPCGGIRIEDDVLVTSGGQENLSRPFLPASAPG